MQGFETRFERLELKYVIDESVAARVRRDLAPYCREDEHNGSASGCGPGSAGYVVRSLYLDTPGLAFHHAKQRGDSERFKLRVRKYAGRTPPVFEIKRRSADFIEKTRVMVDPEQIEEAALGFGKPRKDGPEARQSLDEFSRLVVTRGAEPSLLVRYEREAYTSVVDEYARLNFDRRLAVQLMKNWDLRGDPDGWCEIEQHLSASAPWPPVTLEVKCLASVPHWITDIIRSHDLRRQSFSKYSVGIHVAGRRDGGADLARRCGGLLS